MKTRLVIEWTRMTVRVALAVRRGKRWRLRAFRFGALGPTGHPARTLRELLKGARARHAEVIGIVPREQVITRVVKLPSTQPAELAQMVQVYARGQLPYPGEQAVTDFYVLHQSEGFSTLVVVACQREVLDRQIAVLQEAGISSSLFTVTSWGVLEWYRQLHKDGPASQPAQPCLVINVDDARTDLVLIADGRILSSRSIGQGAQDWQVPGEAVELLILEVERSRVSVRKELPGVEIRALLMTGFGETGAWAQELARRLNLPVETVDAAHPFGTRIAPAALSPAVACGLATGGLGEVVNISPQDVRAQVSHRRQMQELVVVSVLLVGVLTLGAAALALRVSQQRQVAATLQQALREREPIAKRLTEESRAAQMIGAILEDRRRLATVLSHVFQLTPSSVSFEAIVVERRNREVTLRGRTQSTQTVLDFAKQLEEISGIAKVLLNYSTRRATADGERIDFELTLRQQDAAS